MQYNTLLFEPIRWQQTILFSKLAIENGVEYVQN